MADKVLQDQVVNAIKAVAKDLGRVPSRREFTFHELGISVAKIESAFGLWSSAQKAAGFSPNEASKRPNIKEEKFKYKKSFVDSFKVSEVDLAELFELNGNPKVLKFLGMPDTHVENMDRKAVDCFLSFVEWYKPDVFLFYGDFLDAEGISHWPQSTLKPRDFISEVINARELISKIVSLLGDKTHKVYLEGNHEDWISQAMVNKLPELFNGLEKLGLVPDLSKLLDFDKFGINLVKINELFKIGKSLHTHGYYTGNNHPKKHLDVLKNNIYYGHLHDMLSTHAPTLDGTIEAASCGHLSKNDAPFLKGKPNNWQQGFHIIEFLIDGNFSRYPIKINDGRFIFNGIVFGGK